MIHHNKPHLDKINKQQFVVLYLILGLFSKEYAYTGYYYYYYYYYYY